jgi:hypothetical protein
MFISRLVLSLLLGCGAVVQAQGTKPAPGKPPAKGATPPAPSGAEVPEAMAAPPVQEDPIATKAVPYKPVISRDPFLSPNEDAPTGKGDLVDDIGVKGYTKKGGRYFAVVSDRRGTIRELPVGYKFRDGEIAAIDEKAVTFRQWDVNSTVRTAWRTIVKSFKREEGKR